METVLNGWPNMEKIKFTHHQTTDLSVKVLTQH